MANFANVQYCIYVDISGIHVLLFSLLVNQLSGLFLIFLVDQKKIVQSQRLDKKILVSL